jgi:hypothetical protein
MYITRESKDNDTDRYGSNVIVHKRRPDRITNKGIKQVKYS